MDLYRLYLLVKDRPGKPAELADWANTPSVAKRQIVPLWQVKKALIESQEWPGIVAAQGSSTPQIAGLALTAIAYVDDQRFENLDLDLPSTQQLVGGLQAAGLVSAATVAAINAMADTLVSPASEAGITEHVYPHRVAEALEQYTNG